MKSTIIQYNDVRKNYGSLAAVDDISFDVQRGEILVLLGHSGCGKTTSLRLLAGLERPDAGAIWLDGRYVASSQEWVPPEARRIGMVFQDYALFPHLTVRENVAFPLHNLRAHERRRRVDELLGLVGLSETIDRYPHQLSGGQQQRVALARALAPNPSVVLLDEPFSNLDAALRREMRSEVRRILKEAGTTAVFVTHDQEEALSIADRLAVLHRGRILQIDKPQDVYLKPANREVASFLGDANFLPGYADGEAVECALGRLPLGRPAYGDVDVMIRPEAVSVRPDKQGRARVEQVEFFGHDQIVDICVDGQTRMQVRTWAGSCTVPGLAVQLDVAGVVQAYPRDAVL